MEIIRAASAMRAASRRHRAQGLRIGFVPTMGFLHEGHLALIRKAKVLSDWVVVSIFVNPTQFGPNEDLDAYPRDEQRDTELCRAEGVDALFIPPLVEMYAADSSVFVDEQVLSAGLCGGARPGHFRGVVTVVAKLFNMVEPDSAVFGQKDFQQAQIIRRMVRDLGYGVKVVLEPTVRESDGLAMSSRNAYLTVEQRAAAPAMHQSLDRAEQLLAEGVRCADTLRDAMREILTGAGIECIEYIEIVDRGTLAPVTSVENPTVIAVCARLGRARLIDNAVLDPSP